MSESQDAATRRVGTGDQTMQLAFDALVIYVLAVGALAMFAAFASDWL